MGSGRGGQGAGLWRAGGWSLQTTLGSRARPSSTDPSASVPPSCARSWAVGGLRVPELSGGGEWGCRQGLTPPLQPGPCQWTPRSWRNSKES